MINVLLFLVPINVVCYYQKEEFCSSLKCENSNVSVCGIREEGEGVRLRLFQDECELLKHGCKVGDDEGDYVFLNIKHNKLHDRYNPKR